VKEGRIIFKDICIFVCQSVQVSRDLNGTVQVSQ
jgi:hypothetical protein